MSKLLKRIAPAVLALALPMAALADINSTATLATNTRFNMDTGATVTSGGDLLWSGTSLTPQGTATAFAVPGGGGQGLYDSLTQALLAQFAALGSGSPIPSATLTVDAVVGVKTNGGHYAKILVTANAGGSLSFKFTTYGATGGGGGGGGGPTITKIQNNYSYLVSGVPNYGIAPGSLFIIVGSGLAAPGTKPVLWDLSKGPVPTTQDGTSITAVVNNTTVHPAIYYTSESQVAAVLPSNTPVGTGTITVTFNNQTSPAFTLVVVTSALGLDSLYGTGAGLAVATNNDTGALFGYTNSLSQGQVAVLWGSGVGADTSNDDRTYPAKQNNLSYLTKFYVGGIEARILYQGRSAYPGVDQVDIIIPDGAPNGCFVAIVAVSGNIVSNTLTLPINRGGGICRDTGFGLTGDQLVGFGGQTNVRVGALSIGQFTGTNGTGGFTTTTSASGVFQAVQGASYGSGYGLASVGSCIVLEPTASGSGSPFTSTGLDAGASIKLTGPAGSVDLPKFPQLAGFYAPSSPLAASFIPDSGGTFTFNNGAGGVDVKGFNVSLNYPTPPFKWTDMATITTVIRSQGVTVHWTGGALNTYVTISGSATSGTLTVSFTCMAPQADLQFTVPPYVLLALPAGQGSLSLFNSTQPVLFTVTGIDFGTASASTSFSNTPAYQ